MKIIVSACLVGLRTRYDGESNADPEIIKLLKKGDAIPLCPEQLGGLPTPREAVQFVGGDGEAVLKGTAKVLGVDTNTDRTENMIRGAEETLKIARVLGVKRAILKEGSPSCGVNWVKIEGVYRKGMGVTAALLQREGIQVEWRLLPESLKKASRP